MKMFNVKRLTLKTMYIVIITVMALPVIQTDSTDIDCGRELYNTVRKIENWFHGHEVSSIFRHIADEQGLQAVCDKFDDIMVDLKHRIYPECKASDADTQLARLAGYEHICGEGRQQYTQYGKCIESASDKLANCKMGNKDISAIKRDTIYGSPSVKSEICQDMHEYLQCSNKVIEEACNAAKAAEWYQRFMTNIFDEMSNYSEMGCSFGGINFPTWAYFAVAAGLILLLWITCRWLHVSGKTKKACIFVFGDRCLSTDSDEATESTPKSEDRNPTTYAKSNPVVCLEEIRCKE